MEGCPMLRLTGCVQWPCPANITYSRTAAHNHVVNDSTSDISSTSPDHCWLFALSDPKEEQLMQSCLHSHLIECDRCQELRINLFLSLEEEIGKISEQCPMASDIICNLHFLLDDSKDKTEQWKAHILSSVNQEEGKKEVLDKLEPTEALLVEDWAMKFLPLHFREKSAKFYGKRGINWHVTAVIRKMPESSLSVEVFVHVFDSCNQDQIAVVSITQNTLSTLRKLYLELRGVYFRSDNADVIMEDIFWLASPVLVMQLGSESLAMTSAKLNMAKTYAIERQQQWSNMQGTLWQRWRLTF